MIDLKAAIEQNPDCLESSEKFRNYLNDLYPSRADKACIKVLADVISCGIVSEIRSGKTSSLDIDKYHTLLMQKNGYSSRLACEYIKQWLTALLPDDLFQEIISVDQPKAASNFASITKKFVAKMQAGEIHTHIFEDTIIAPTCRDHGYTLHQCKCGYEYKDRFTPFGDHIFEIVESVMPTCKETGRKDYLCSACSAYMSKTIPIVAHQFSDWSNSQEPTCEQDCIQERRCVMCGETDHRVIPAQGHQWSEWIDQVFPTCLEDGIKARQCKICKKIEEVSIPATGHEYSEWDFSKVKSGKYERFCQKCGFVEYSDTDPDWEKRLFKIENGELKEYTGIGDCIVNIPEKVNRIGEYCFSSSCNLNTVTIPASVVSIGTGAFCDCQELVDISLPYGLTSIGANAFFNCCELEEITIPDTVTVIGKFAFSGCTNLQSIEVPDGVVAIECGTFFGCESLKEISLPNGIEHIGQAAFAGCESLEEFTIPDCVGVIEEKAFAGCIGLESITIPNEVISIGNDVFNECENLTDIYYCGTEEEWNNLIHFSNIMDDLDDVEIHFNEE